MGANQHSAHLDVIRAAFEQLGWNMTPVNALEEQVQAMQRELEQWSAGFGPGPERMKELREAQRGR